MRTPAEIEKAIRQASVGKLGRARLAQSPWAFSPGSAVILREPTPLPEDAPIQRRRLLVTGTPNSGSRFIAKLLRRVGLAIGHEKMNPDGIVSSLFCVDDFWYPGTHLGRRDQFEFEQVWHQVRHPLKVIASMSAGGDMPGQIRHWQQRHTGIPGDLQPRVLRWARFWLVWTEFAEKSASWTYRIEDIDAIWPEMLDRLGLEPQDRPDLRTDVGTKNPHPISWEDIDAFDADVSRALRAAARRFGYEETA